MLGPMAATPSDIRLRRTRRALRLVNEYAGWACLVIVGLSAFLFLNARSDLVRCSANFADENNRVQQVRTDAAVANTKALNDVIVASQPLLNPDQKPTVKQQVDAYTAFKNFSTTSSNYEMVAKANPIPTYESFCGQAPDKGDSR